MRHTTIPILTVSKPTQNPDKDPSADSNEESINRRRYIKKLATTAAASGAATAVLLKWEKPMVSAVFLPAHATTSDVGAGGGMMDPTTTPAAPTPMPEPTPAPEPTPTTTPAATTPP